MRSIIQRSNSNSPGSLILASILLLAAVSAGLVGAILAGAFGSHSAGSITILFEASLNAALVS